MKRRPMIRDVNGEVGIIETHSRPHGAVGETAVLDQVQDPRGRLRGSPDQVWPDAPLLAAFLEGVPQGIARSVG